MKCNLEFLFPNQNSLDYRSIKPKLNSASSARFSVGSIISRHMRAVNLVVQEIDSTYHKIRFEEALKQ